MNGLGRARLYWNTLRHLKPVQFYGRLRFRLLQPRIDTKLAPPAIRERQGAWREPAARRPSMLAADRFSFLNSEHRIAQATGWNDPGLDKLWLYNLHYFDDLNAAGADSRHAWQDALLQRWVAENPPMTGTGWEPYPTSLRMVNWIKWAMRGNTLPEDCVVSLAAQARWLMRRLEWHLLGNHLFANAKALIFAGLFFDDTEAKTWLTTGLRIAARELGEQVLPDGGNFERSPMYHAIFLEDILDLTNAAKAFPGTLDRQVVQLWERTAERMLAWAEGMTHPDGEIALFNDAAFGIAPPPAELRAYAARLGLDAIPSSSAPCLRHWPDSGYIRLECANAVALLDVAEIGPDYLPGHAHADTLSFELSIHGRRVIVNGGTSRYGLSPERLRERATAAHSTVEVDGENSSEVWSGFRVARRAHPFGLETRDRADMLTAACSHDGYMRLPGRPVHRREWALAPGRLIVRDVVSGPHRRAIARFILHPDIRIARNGEHDWTMTLPGDKNIAVSVEEGSASLEEARYAPEFGKLLPTRCLAVELISGKATTTLSWVEPHFEAIRPSTPRQ